MFNIRIFKILKMFKYNKKLIRAARWVNSKISNRDKNTTLMIFLFYDYCWSLLWYNYWRSWNSTSWSHLKLTVQIQLALYLWDPFLINNRNVTGKIIFCCVECKVRSKTKIQNVLLTSKPVSTALTLNSTTKPVPP